MRNPKTCKVCGRWSAEQVRTDTLRRAALMMAATQAAHDAFDSIARIEAVGNLWSCVHMALGERLGLCWDCVEKQVKRDSAAFVGALAAGAFWEAA